MSLQDMASFKIATLQKQLDTSVAAEDLGLANKRYTELTEKYRDLLGKSNMLVARTEESSGYEVTFLLSRSLLDRSMSLFQTQSIQ